jgi:hypothetical protein
VFQNQVRFLILAVISYGGRQNPSRCAGCASPMRRDQACFLQEASLWTVAEPRGKFRSHLSWLPIRGIVGRHASTYASPLDRRRFLLNAGFAAAGSVIGSTLLSCANVTDGTVIPCLGPAAAPSPVPGMSYIRASEIGCALDCDLEWGYNKYTMGHATDDGPRINAAMAGASASHPITLIIDGSALISGLFLPAGGYWSIAGLGCGTGFFIKSGTNNDGIHNGPPDAAVPFDPGPPAPPRGMNVSLSNFTLNGNQGNGRNGDSSSGLPRGNDLQFFCSINLMNLDNIRIENVVVVNSPAYHFRLSNVGNVVATGCYMESHGLATDGMHFDGPANDISISNCTFATGDDSIALNCPEGYSGNISRVTVTNCTFNSWTLMRLYTTYSSPIKDQIDSVSVSHCSGTLAEAAFLIGLSSGSIPDSVASLTVSDCTLKAPTILGVAENFGNITLKNIIFTPSLSGVVWNPPITNRICAFLRPTPPYGGGTTAGSSLTLENCQIIRDGHTKVAAVILENGSTIDNVLFNGFTVQDSYPPLPDLLIIGNGSIGQLALSSISSNNITNPIAAGGFAKMGLVLGAGVLATGWEFPDAVMANEVPYISANSGLPSIKVGGVVELYSST